METILQVLQEEPIILRRINKKIPKDLQAICLKCLEKNAAGRYQTAAELSEDLHRFLVGEPIRARNDWRRRFRTWTIREPVLAAHLTATFFLTTAILINYWVLGEGRESDFRVLLKNEGILAGWALVVLVLQKTHNTSPKGSWIPFAWAAINPIFLTITLCVNGAPRGALLSLYFLFLVTTCFFRRVELVATCTIFSLIGYTILIMLFFEESEIRHVSYLVIFGVNLAVSGALLGFLALRLKRLGQQETK